MSVIYIAYQGDVPDFQTVSVHDGDESPSQFKERCRQVFNALLDGWWGKMECYPSGFIYRIDDGGFECYAVNRDDDCVVSVSHKPVESDAHPADLPPHWPAFVSLVRNTK